MTCFQLALQGGLFPSTGSATSARSGPSTHFTIGDVRWATTARSRTLHFMPTVFIPTTYIGYSPTGASLAGPGSTSTGATVVYFPNLYADIKGIPWLFGGTAWAGTRYYKRESIYISDFFYWNPSGVGAGIEDINLGVNLRLSYGAFAVDGQPGTPPDARRHCRSRVDFGIRNDLQLRGIKPWQSGEFQIGFQYIADFSEQMPGNPTHGGWGVTLPVRAAVARRRQQARLPVRQGRGHGLRNARALLLPRLLAPPRPQRVTAAGRRCAHHSAHSNGSARRWPSSTSGTTIARQRRAEHELVSPPAHAWAWRSPSTSSCSARPATTA